MELYVQNLASLLDNVTISTSSAVNMTMSTGSPVNVTISTSNPVNVTMSTLSQENVVLSTSIGILLYIITAVTIIGNVLVLVAVRVEKRLHTLFNYYIVNLAVTDVAVAMSAMSFYSLDVVLGYWPFGEFMCGVWIFFDYGMTFASVFTLCVISFDRFWSVTWSLHYRRNHNKRKCIFSIAGVWLGMLVLWLPACITDRIENSEPLMCIWEPSLNKEYVIVVATIGHHTPFCFMLYCYFKVAFFMWERRKVQVQLFGRKLPMQMEPSSAATVSTVERVEVPSNSVTKFDASQLGPNSLAPSDHAISQEAESRKAERTKEKEQDKERKVFVTLTYIIAGYVICWFPFHIVFDISSIAPEAVPDAIYRLTFYMTYFNSTINPFLYNFSSPEFKKTFKNIFLLKYWRR